MTDLAIGAADEKCGFDWHFDWHFEILSDLLSDRLSHPCCYRELSMGAELLDKKQLLIDKKKYAFANIFAHAIVEAPFEYKYNNYIKLYE